MDGSEYSDAFRNPETEISVADVNDQIARAPKTTTTTIYLFIIYYTRTYFRHSGVGTQFRQERREGSEKMVEKKKDRGTEGKTPHPNPGN